MRRFTRFVPLLLLGVLAPGAISARLIPGAQGAAALVKAAPAHMLVTSSGMTLYVYSKDQKGTSACTGKCATFWPPLMVPAGSKVGASMAGVMGTFGEITRAGGKHQLTYDGAPLYTFAADKKAGDMHGQGVGGVWWAVVVPGM